MTTRRQTLALIAAVAATPVLAQAQSRANPMPDELRTALERDRNGIVLGNPAGNITLVEFFDYNCPFCKKILPKMQQLISADPQLRVVFREWPVFGADSEFAARVALAALDQGKYWQVHAGLMGMRDRAAEPSVMRVVRKLGLDEAKLRRDMDSDRVSDHIARSFMLADHMGLVGTPTMIAGDEGVFGDQSLKDLQDLVARARATMGVAAG
ncbi:DsbA family protein [Paracoccus alkenifer]|uniref:Protein-disulfide isomerase n=1 Tax=Paracoccus alkenifer TaxID=65735 RepID=A0A1H6JUR5_9RHOB|nr:DsbA family protein [Paracoccus alkenifer]SEH63661.1 Protein-disulfide isomerase [Paracoccus alkenifer]